MNRGSRPDIYDIIRYDYCKDRCSTSTVHIATNVYGTERMNATIALVGVRSEIFPIPLVGLRNICNHKCSPKFSSNPFFLLSHLIYSIALDHIKAAYWAIIDGGSRAF